MSDFYTKSTFLGEIKERDAEFEGKVKKIGPHIFIFYRNKSKKICALPTFVCGKHGPSAWLSEIYEVSWYSWRPARTIYINIIYIYEALGKDRPSALLYKISSVISHIFVISADTLYSIYICYTWDNSATL